MRVNKRELVISTLACLAVGGLWFCGWMAPLERPVHDALLRLQSSSRTGEQFVAAVLIDDISIAELGPLPWPRQRLAVLISKIRAGCARAIVLDILLSEPAPGDDELAHSLAGGPIALAAVLDPEMNWIAPIKTFGGFENAAHAHAEISRDGVVRSIATSKQSDGVSLRALSVMAASFADERFAIEAGTVFRPDFRIPPYAIPSLSASGLLLHGADSSVLYDKVVFVGVSASGAGDQFIVPVDNKHKPSIGVLVHAAAASSLLRGGLLHILPWWVSAALAFGFAWIVQRLRSQSESLDIYIPIVVFGAISLLPFPFLMFGKTLMPSVSFVMVVGLAITIRESIESREARKESTQILMSLINDDNKDRKTVSGVRGRLRLARSLQAQIINDRNLRETMLEGLDEGVVLWNLTGAPVLHNKALLSLCGEPPPYDRIMSEQHEGSTEFEHMGRVLEATVHKVESGYLGLVRDISELREVEIRRRDMQRLVSHELKTPLASIAGFGDMLVRYELTPEELAKTAGLIRSEAERLGEMVRRLLDLERLEAGKWQEQATDFDLGELVVERCEIVLGSANDDTFMTMKIASPCTIKGERELIAQMVDNLIGNALKYSGSPELVMVQLFTKGKQPVLEISDRGPGIPADALPHVFEKFYRVPGARVRGTGLGLSLVKEVVDRHGAHISLTSEVDHGTTVTVVFAEELRD